jgi:hypothetical protein
MGKSQKTRSNAQRASVSSDASNPDKLDEILERLAGLDNITKKLTKLESMLAATQEENKQLKEVINNQNIQMLELKDRVNNLEQHGRSFSIRVNNLPLDSTEEKDPPLVIKKVYDTVFLPILKGAAGKQVISSVPTCYEMVEMAHPLPGKKDRPKPIIVRFFNRNLKAILFKHRKEFAPTIEDGSRKRYQFPFHDDLTRDTFSKMKQLQSDPRVDSCWSTGGTLRYKLTGCSIIRRVSSVYMTNDDILK